MSRRLGSGYITEEQATAAAEAILQRAPLQFWHAEDIVKGCGVSAEIAKQATNAVLQRLRRAGLMRFDKPQWVLVRAAKKRAAGGNR